MISLSAYNTPSNPYTIPSDGYIALASDNAASNCGFLFIDENAQYVCAVGQTGQGFNMVRVYKGMRGYSSITASASVRFCPIEDAN